MLSRAKVNRFQSLSIVLIVVYVVLDLLGVYKRLDGWRYLLLLPIVGIAIYAGVLRARYRAEKRAAVKSAEASLLKHKWEEKQNREW